MFLVLTDPSCFAVHTQRYAFTKLILHQTLRLSWLSLPHKRPQTQGTFAKGASRHSEERQKECKCRTALQQCPSCEDDPELMIRREPPPDLHPSLQPLLSCTDFSCPAPSQGRPIQSKGLLSL